MKKVSVALFAAVVLTSTLAAPQTQTNKQSSYTIKFDHINVQNILKRNRFIKCLLDTVRYNPEGQELKKVLPDALKTNCEKCNKNRSRKSFSLCKWTNPKNGIYCWINTIQKEYIHIATTLNYKWNSDFHTKYTMEFFNNLSSNLNITGELSESAGSSCYVKEILIYVAFILYLIHKYRNIFGINLDMFSFP